MDKKNQPNLTRLIGKVHDLPTLPRTVMQITELVNKPSSSARDLAKVITEDQILTARLLKLVNSSYYGFPQKISTVTAAIVLLGFDAIRNLLLTSSILTLFSSRDKKDKEKLEQFWDHSLGCAVGAKIIGKYIRYDKIEELFVAGLLHDIGKIVEMLFLTNDFEKVLLKIEDEHILMATAELEVLGYTHAEVGKFLAKKWNLPAKLINVIANHHNPEQAGRFVKEASAIHLADIMCRALNLGYGGDNKIPALNKNAWSELQLSKNSIETIMEEIDREYRNLSTVIAPA